jgi:acyl-[acyl carrier protein]--UDP-N-acetylglucosamine O-acyltransferase
MRLQEIQNNISGNLIKDGYFTELGHSTVTKRPNLLTFCDNKNFVDLILNNKNISCVVTTENLAKEFILRDIGIIVSDNPRFDFFVIHNTTAIKNKKKKTIIGENLNISNNCVISKNNVKIGNNCYLEEGVIIRKNVVLGNDVIVRSGSVIGGQGFQFSKSDNSVLKINHFGNVNIGNNVEIKEFCSIHTAVFNWDETSVGEDTKIDSHTHIGHGNQIGKRVFICSHANISGNSIIEDNCYVGPGVNIPNRLHVGNNVKISVGSTLTKDVPNNLTVSGHFAISHDKYIKHIKAISKNTSI